MSGRADYDYRGLGIVLRDRLTATRRGWRPCAIEIGVTMADLSRLASGQPVSAHKVIAVCDWLGISFRAFYEPPRSAPDASSVGAAPGGVFHGAHTGTAAKPGVAGS